MKNDSVALVSPLNYWVLNSIKCSLRLFWSKFGSLKQYISYVKERSDSLWLTIYVNVANDRDRQPSPAPVISARFYCRAWWKPNDGRKETRESLPVQSMADERRDRRDRHLGRKEGVSRPRPKLPSSLTPDRPNLAHETKFSRFSCSIHYGNLILGTMTELT